MSSHAPNLRLIVLLSVVVAMPGCQNTRPAPSTSPGSFTVGGSTFSPANLILNGPVPGCADAIELVNQTAVLPPMPLTLDAQNVFDRVDTSATGATYTFALRPVNPINCASTTLPASPPITVTFGFNYSGDFSRVNPLCMNASTLAMTGFNVSGTPVDALIEPAFREVLWRQLDEQVTSSLQPIINGGEWPDNTNPRCGNWVDQTTL